MIWKVLWLLIACCGLLAAINVWSENEKVSTQQANMILSKTFENNWGAVLELDSARKIVDGSPDELAAAIRRGADLRILTTFLNNEHVDTKSDSSELIREVCDFQITYLIDNRWVAALMQMRQPVSLPLGFGGKPSMSFFLYNQDGEQGIARPFLDGQSTSGKLGPGGLPEHSDMPKYHQHDSWDPDTNAPSHNFVYDFDVFRYFVNDHWREVLEHDANGKVVSGSVEALADAFAQGRQVKLAIRDLCHELAGDDQQPLTHEVFIQASSCYYYTEQRLFVAGANPLVRVRPGIPLQYTSGGWDVCWLVARTDGAVSLRRLDPYSLKFEDRLEKFAVRWFVK